MNNLGQDADRAAFEKWASTLLWKNLDHKNCAEAAWQAAKADSRAIQDENKRLTDLLSIREVAYDMNNKAGKEIERLAEQNAAMQDALEQVCEALGMYAASDNGAYQLLKGFKGRVGDVCPRSPANKALSLAAPFRKTELQNAMESALKRALDTYDPNLPKTTFDKTGV